MTPKLTKTQWNALKDKLSEKYPPSLFLIREKMKDVLGFTIRDQRVWVPDDGPSGAYDGNGHHETFICLDFFDEEKQTLFLLKYGHYLHDNPSS